MPLTWSVEKVENYEENFPSVTRVEEPMPVHDEDGNVVDHIGEHREYEAWNPITDVLVMMNMILGMPKLTADNVDEMYRRVCMYEKISGGSVLRNNKTGEPRSITLAEVRGHIGMTDNATPRTNKEFDKHMARILREEADRQVLDAYAKEVS